MTIVKIKDKEFYLDEFLRRRLDNLKTIVFKKNWDGVFIVDGLERVGKSTLGITLAYYLSDGNFTVKNICADSKDATKKIESFPDKSVLLIDEGSLVFNSRDAMKKEQKQLIKILNVVGQKNMIFIIVLPCFFDLNRSIAIRRSKFLLHCYTDTTLQRGRFAYFGEDAKKILYTLGKKNFDSYQKPKRSRNELGRYTNFNPLGDEYLETKKKSLYSALHEDYRKERNKVSEVWKQIIKNVDEYKPEFKFNQRMKCEMLKIHKTTYQKYTKLIAKDELFGRTTNREQLMSNPLIKDDDDVMEKEADNKVINRPQPTPEPTPIS